MASRTHQWAAIAALFALRGGLAWGLDITNPKAEDEYLPTSTIVVQGKGGMPEGVLVVKVRCTASGVIMNSAAGTLSAAGAFSVPLQPPQLLRDPPTQTRQWMAGPARTQVVDIERNEDEIPIELNWPAPASPEAKPDDATARPEKDERIPGVEVTAYKIERPNATAQEARDDKLAVKVGEAFNFVLTYKVADDRPGEQSPARARIVRARPDGRFVIVDEGGSLVREVSPGVYRMEANDLSVLELPAGRRYSIRVTNEHGVLWEKPISVSE